MGIFLRALRPDDAAYMLEWMNDEAATLYLGGGFTKKRTLEDVQDYIHMRLDGEFTGETYAIAEGETGEYLGQCDLMLPDPAAQKAEIAIVVLPRHQGRSIATQALQLLIQKAFSDGYNRLHLKVCTENQKAMRLYERLGFKREGTLRQDINVQGRLCDVAVYGMLKSDVVQFEKGVTGL